ATIVETGGQTVYQTESAVRGLEDDGAAVRARVLLVKLDDQRLPKKIRKQNRLCGRFRHARPPSVEEMLRRAQPFYHTGVFAFTAFRELSRLTRVVLLRGFLALWRGESGNIWIKQTRQYPPNIG